MIFMSCAESHGPNQPCSAEQQHVDQAGDHGRDRERQIDQRDQQLLPRNSNLAIAHAAAMPNSTLSGDGNCRRQERQADGGEAIGLGERCNIGRRPLRKAR